MKTLTENINQAINDFNSIKSAIEAKGVVVANNATSQYGQKVSEIQTSTGWKLEPDWFDVATILANDKDSSSYKIICLLTDELDNNTSITKKVKGAAKYKLSDGQTISNLEEVDISNIFDTTKDKTCSKGYKTRYIIYYISTLNKGNIVIPNNTIYSIFFNVDFEDFMIVDASYLQNIKTCSNKYTTNTVTNFSVTYIENGATKPILNNAEYSFLLTVKNFKGTGKLKNLETQEIKDIKIGDILIDGKYELTTILENNTKFTINFMINTKGPEVNLKNHEVYTGPKTIEVAKPSSIVKASLWNNDTGECISKDINIINGYILNQVGLVSYSLRLEDDMGRVTDLYDILVYTK